MDCSHCTPDRLPLSMANCHGEKITLISYIQVIGSLSPCQKMRSFFWSVRPIFSLNLNYDVS